MRKRDLPSHITETNCQAYQVRIVRDGHEYSSSFSFARTQDREAALAEAVAWRDDMLRRLPPSSSSRGSYRKEPLPHKKTVMRAGVTRYVTSDSRRVGNPLYLRYAVSYVDETRRPRVKSFQVGRLADVTWQDELHASKTAIACREHWEFCVDHGLKFEPDLYEGWQKRKLYPFDPKRFSFAPLDRA